MNGSMTPASFVPCPPWCEKPADHEIADLATGDTRWHDKRFGDVITYSVNDEGDDRVVDVYAAQNEWLIDSDSEILTAAERSPARRGRSGCCRVARGAVVSAPRLVPSNGPTYVHITMAQRLLGDHEYVVRGLVVSGELPSVKIDGRTYIAVNEVAAPREARQRGAAGAVHQVWRGSVGVP